MPPLSNVLAFAVTVVVIVAVPGPSVLFAISRALTVGRRATLVTVAGNAAGVALQVVAVAFGMGAVVQASAVAYRAITYAGAAYLCYLGVQAIRHRRSMAAALAARVVAISPWRAARDGFVGGVTNPKTIVILVTVMPAFTAPAAGPLWSQMLLLGALFPVTALVLDSVWAIVAGTARDWFARSPRRAAAVGGAGGVIMVGLGLGIAVAGRPG